MPDFKRGTPLFMSLGIAFMTCGHSYAGNGFPVGEALPMIGNLLRHNKVQTAAATPTSPTVPSRPPPTVSQAASLKTRGAIRLWARRCRDGCPWRAPSLVLQGEIRRSEQSSYEHRLHGLLLVARGRVLIRWPRWPFIFATVRGRFVLGGAARRRRSERVERQFEKRAMGNETHRKFCCVI